MARNLGSAKLCKCPELIVVSSKAPSSWVGAETSPIFAVWQMPLCAVLRRAVDAEEYWNAGHESISSCLWVSRSVQRQVREMTIRNVWLTIAEEYERRGYIWRRGLGQSVRDWRYTYMAA
jgi:hypothetical protein